MRSFVPLVELSAEEASRFASKVERGAECHLWTGSRDRYGRGRISLRRYPMLAPRVAYKMAFGMDPAEQKVLHRCDNPQCVNPAHLFLGSQADNVADASFKGRIARGDTHIHNRRAGKLNESIVAEIKRAIRNGARTSDLARQYDVGPAQISNIKHGHKWRWLNAA